MCDKQRLNLHRLFRLLLEASTDTLRYFFEKLYSPQGDLQSFLKINRKKIKSLYKRNVITSDQKEILKPSNGTLPLLSNLDITLLCILLTNLCQVGKPQSGWTGDPDDKDLSIGADILRLRKTRNKLYAHRPDAMMTDSDFQETWGKTCGVISRLSSHLDQKQQEDIQSKIDEISKAQVDPETLNKMFDILSHALCKIHVLNRSGDPEDVYHEDAEEAETEIAKGYDGIICVIKLYPELKSNMTRRSLTAIAKRLLDGKMISEDEYERLQDTTKPRRCLTDMLLKKILRVDPEKAELLKCFLYQLRIHHPAMATKISQMEVTEAERTAFRQAKQYGVVGKNAHVTSQNSHKLTDNEISFFERCLCESPDRVDSINDQLLSKFLISISDHSLINKSDKMISDLFKKVQLHNLDVESVLEHVLEENMLEEWKKLRCEVPVTATLDQVMQGNGHVMKDKEMPNPCSTLENTVVHIETAVGDAKDDDKMTNFCRFFLLVMDPGKLTLQSFLEKQYSAKGDLQLFLKSKEREVNKLCSKHIIKQWQVDVLLPTTGDVPTVKNLDIYTICILLIYLCQITKPPNGWKELPSNNDRSTGADILRLLHATENLVFYRKAGGMSAQEFNEKWDNIHGAISRLSIQLDGKEIDDIRSKMSLIREESIDPGKERKINDEMFKRFLPQMGENQEMRLDEIITMDVDDVCSDQHNQGSFTTLLGWMRDAANAVMNGFATQFQSDLKAVEKRSIVIKLRVWKDLKDQLLDKDFVGKNLRRLIRRGCFESKVELRGPVHVTVYIFSPEAQGEKEEIHFHLELDSIKHDVKKPRVHLKSQDIKLLIEEMDPIGLQHWIFDQLQTDVNKQKIMNEIVSWQDLSRRDQMEVLLDSIKRLENGFDMLAQYCKENDPYVYNKVFKKQEQLACPEESDTDQKAAWSSYRKGGGLQKLYSMQLDLDVEEQEILKMDTRSVQMYKEALKKGIEKVYNIRVMVVGLYGVGKTTLIKRLLEKDVNISERKITERIGVCTERCRISLATGEWTTPDKNAEQYSRLQRLVKLLDKHVRKQELKCCSSHQGELDDMVTSKECGNRHLQHDQQVNAEQDFNQKVKSALKSADVNMGLGVSSKNEEKDAMIEILKLVNENADKLEKNMEEYATVSLCDFSGQIVYYTTHQIFLTSRAIYLLVIDLSQQITDLLNDESFHDTEEIKLSKVRDSIEIWLNSIHSCALPSKAGIPHVILVGTHVDKIPEKSRYEVICNYFRKLLQILKVKPTVLHVVDHIAIDNTHYDPMLEVLKRRIFELGSMQPHWGEETPARWLLLEQAIMRLRDAGCKIVPLSLVEEISLSGSVKIEDRDELELFLIYQHELRTILYFSVTGLREKIVLDLQWFIDAQNSLITAEFIIRKYPAIISQWIKFKECGKLTHTLIDAIWTKEHPDFHDNKDHILLLMEKLNIIVRPRSYIADGGIKEEDYYLVPCMLRQAIPKEIIYPKSDSKIKSTSVLCFVYTENFMPAPIFHSLLGACLTRWPIARARSENLIGCGYCVFNLDNIHRLTLHFRNYVIFARVRRMGLMDVIPSSLLCNEVRMFIFENLSKITGNLGQSLHFELYIQCPYSDAESLEGLIPVSQLKKNEKVVCYSHRKSHTLESQELQYFWFQDEVNSRKMRNIGQSQSKGDVVKLHWIVLNKCLPKLIMDLDVDTVFVYIQLEQLLDDVSVHDILEQKTTSDKTTELIRQIQQRGQDTYERFKDCLVLSKQAYLKDMLEEEEAKVLKELMTHGAQETGDELKRQFQAYAPSKIQVPEVQVTTTQTAASSPASTTKTLSRAAKGTTCLLL